MKCENWLQAGMKSEREITSCLSYMPSSALRPKSIYQERIQSAHETKIGFR